MSTRGGRMRVCKYASMRVCESAHLGFEVPVHHALLMAEGHNAEHLADHHNGLRLREPPPSAHPQRRAEASRGWGVSRGRGVGNGTGEASSPAAPLPRTTCATPPRLPPVTSPSLHRCDRRGSRSLLHGNVHMQRVFIRVVKVDNVFIARQSVKNLHFPSDIIDGHC